MCVVDTIADDENVGHRETDETHESPHFRRTRKGLNLGFLKRLDEESAGWGIDAGTEGAI
jgi:hypothetical protein